MVGSRRASGSSLSLLQWGRCGGGGAREGRWPLLRVAVIHRYGRIAPGERIVFVAVAAAHRGAAFAAAEMLMDYLKTRAPFWKRAIRSDGAIEGWIESKGEDDRSAARWSAAG